MADNTADWTKDFRGPALAKIRECEAFLAEYGIMPVSGFEQEFIVEQKQPRDSKGRFAELDNHFKMYSAFRNSPFVERFYRDDTISSRDPNMRRQVWEIVTGRGVGTKKNIHFATHRRLPSVQVGALESIRKLIEQERDKPKYNVLNLTYDATSEGYRVRGLHVNTSLWFQPVNSSSHKPSEKISLFLGNYTSSTDIDLMNDLVKNCTTSIREAQNALIALITTNPNAIERFKCGLFGTYLDTDDTLKYRSKDQGKTYYLENRLSGSDVLPSIAMLVSVVGLTEGVKRYLADHNIKTPKEFEAHIHSPEFNEVHVFNYVRSHKYPLPTSQQEALATTKNSPLAKELLGEEFHSSFCNAYAENMKRSPQIGRGH